MSNNPVTRLTLDPLKQTLVVTLRSGTNLGIGDIARLEARRHAQGSLEPLNPRQLATFVRALFDANLLDRFLVRPMAAGPTLVFHLAPWTDETLMQFCVILGTVVETNERIVSADQAVGKLTARLNKLLNLNQP